MCGMPDPREKTAWFGHWIPAQAGMTCISPRIFDCPVELACPASRESTETESWLVAPMNAHGTETQA